MEVNPEFPVWRTNILIRAIGLFGEAYSKMMMVRLYGSGLTRTLCHSNTSRRNPSARNPWMP